MKPWRLSSLGVKPGSGFYGFSVRGYKSGFLGLAFNCTAYFIMREVIVMLNRRHCSILGELTSVRHQHCHLGKADDCVAQSVR